MDRTLGHDLDFDPDITKNLACFACIRASTIKNLIEIHPELSGDLLLQFKLWGKSMIITIQERAVYDLDSLKVKHVLSFPAICRPEIFFCDSFTTF